MSAPLASTARFRSVDDGSVTFPGGRRVAYRTYGARDGLPLLALHGTPGSRLKFSVTEGPAAALGLRVIAIDRWGYGDSDPHPMPSLSAFASDMEAFIDAFGIDRLALLGISGGGPYAAAVAAVLSDRVLATALVGPVGPIAGALPAGALSAFHRFAFGAFARRPWMMRTAFGLFRRRLLAGAPTAMHLVVARAPKVDRDLMRDPGVCGRLAETFRLGLAKGTLGMETDMRLFSQAWPIDLAAVRSPARIWIGSRDTSVPLAAVQALARGLPRCEVTDLTGEGHLWVAEHYPEVLGWVASAAAIPR